MSSRVSPLIAPKRPRLAQSRLDAVRMATSGPTRESASSRDDQQEGSRNPRSRHADHEPDEAQASNSHFVM